MLQAFSSVCSMRPVWYALSGRLQVRAKQSLSPAAWACHDRVDRTDQLNQLVYYRSRAAALVPVLTRRHSSSSMIASRESSCQ